MKYDPAKHHRRSIRLKGYDYSQAGLCFITLCCQNRKPFFGRIEDGQMNLNNAGIMVKNEWLKLPERFQNIELHEYIVMPNHFHAILEIVVGATLVVAPNAAPKVGQNNKNINEQPQGIVPTGKNVGALVGAFKSIVTVNYIRGVNNTGWMPFD